MKKIITLAAAVLATAGIINAEPISQKAKLEVIDMMWESVCNPFVVNVTYENGVYTIDNYLGSGVPFSFIYDAETEEASATGDNLYQKYPDEEEWADLYGLWNDKTDSEAEFVLKNYMGEGEDQTIYNADIFKSSVMMMDWGDGPFLSCSFYGYTDPEDDFSMTDFLESRLYFQPVSDDNAVEVTTADSAPVYYNLQGAKVENPSKGIFIKKAGNSTSKVIL